MIEPIPDELAQLIAAERTAPVTDTVAQAAVRAKLAIAVGHAPLGAAGIGVAGKVLALLAVVVGAGAGTKLLLDHLAGAAGASPVGPRSSPAVTTASATGDVSAVSAAKAATSATGPTVTPPVATHAVTAAAASSTAPAIAPRMTTASASVASASTATAAFVAGPTSSNQAGSVTTERAVPLQPVGTNTPTEAELLRQAWATRDASVALELVHRDAALHPDGALSEERIALEVRALANLHRLDEARATAARFFIEFPHTVHRAIVERALAPKDTP